VPQFAVKLVTVTLVAALATGAEGLGDGVGVNVAVAVGVGVNVAVGVAVGGGVAVGVEVGGGVGRGLGTAERLPSAIKPHAPAATHAIAMSRLILRKKGLSIMLWGALASLSYYGSSESKFRKFWTSFNFRRFKNCPAVWKWSDFDDCHRNSACFLQNQHKCSFEHERAPKHSESANRAGRGRTVPAPTIPRASRSSLSWGARAGSTGYPDECCFDTTR
jgi:hypothetical protein